MKEIDISKYSKYSLELIFSEADKLSDQILKSISENRNKSFWLFAFISSLFSYSFVKIIETNYDYFMVLIGAIISCVILRKNLFPQTIQFNGALPENMLIEYFHTFKDEELDKEYLACQIQSYNSAMLKNKELISKMVIRFKIAVWSILITFFIFGILFLFRFVECLPT
jgi:ABC-type multidrug transport system fused ATPase/permease subunit